MITYKKINNYITLVYLDKKKMGKIKKRDMLSGGFTFQYFPAGQVDGGEMFDTLSECEISLERDV